MDKFDQFESTSISFKKSLLYSLLIVSATPLMSGLYSSSGVDVVVLTCTIIGASISTPLLYYFINHRSFKPMKVLYFLLMMFPNALLSGLFAFLTLYFLNLLGLL
ncbi:MAG: hypothetical protein L0J40_07615 [Alkalibacterium sp.]|uniref:Uncharacterized protein n=1 Tax=Alkalibacterium gilvum TaxID=1130080 RepID=A0A1H6S328_9LACT|nr:hypothetical protein [Alkalibacterium gilvum]MDN6294476.1 hypothetical protein [Alkalibacterium sp.]SEI62299.1 hypothetical protein SAMN04488113_1066 [Alkalibacterium gilvum]